jgi:hypothetical protein
VKERGWATLQSDRLQNQSFMEQISSLDDEFGWDTQYEEHYHRIPYQNI